MDYTEIEKNIDNIKVELNKLENKEFAYKFFVYDTKGVASGSLTYIYETALCLHNLGYKVEMLYIGKDFVGTEEWAGERYNVLKHYNIETDNVKVAPSDILFIPEIMNQLMEKTINFPCKRVVISQNTDYMFENLPIKQSFNEYGINDIIVTSNNLANKIKQMFGCMKIDVVRPHVIDIFEKPTKISDFVVNIVSKDYNNINSIVKQFYLKYPMLSFVTFRYLNGAKKEDFADALKNSVITVWEDEYTDFGISALESMACNNIVIGKIPDSEPEWMCVHNEDGSVTFKDNGFWYYNNKDVHSLIAYVIESYLNNNVSQTIYDNMEKTVNEYREDKFIEDVKNVYINGFINHRKEEFNYILSALENKLKENENKKDE